ncbi:636_t:CDS:2 [Diversispora eburnea]|uniref:636_t:CDS:1 n=1 Tax=Diversispora eburnea TaxID=1213867 RepID=A0A9N9FGJ8_9GLOM|nr:636_t:CDS:2 [Diversispora eburnea]
MFLRKYEPLTLCRVFILIKFTVILLAVLIILSIGVRNDSPTIATNQASMEWFPTPDDNSNCSEYITQPTLDVGSGLWTGKFSSNLSFPDVQIHGDFQLNPWGVIQRKLFRNKTCNKLIERLNQPEEKKYIWLRLADQVDDEMNVDDEKELDELKKLKREVELLEAFIKLSNKENEVPVNENETNKENEILVNENETYLENISGSEFEDYNDDLPLISTIEIEVFEELIKFGMIDKS